jgi:hypothetical protein
MELTKTVVWRDGPFGSPGTVMWLCKEHHHLVTSWNNDPLSPQDAIESAIKISKVTWNDETDVVREY